MSLLRAWLLVGIVSACGGSPRVAAPPAPTPVAAPTGAQVMVLGVYHFGNPGLDYVQVGLDDHGSAERRAQIDQVVAALAGFRPTVILIEHTDQAAIDAAYQEVRSGARPAAVDETEQLAFRLAAQLQLPAPIAIDHPGDMDFDRLMAAAQASDDHVFLTGFSAVIAEVEAEAAARLDHTVADNLRLLNDPAHVARDHALYLLMARVAHGDDFAGADVLAAWYQRNFRIFAKLAAAIPGPEARVLVVYGAGHAALLRELISASPDLVLVEPNAYLPLR